MTAYDLFRTGLDTLQIAEALMHQAYKDAGISPDQDEPLEALIEVATA